MEWLLQEHIGDISHVIKNYKGTEDAKSKSRAELLEKFEFVASTPLNISNQVELWGFNPINGFSV